ncbi:hypothetical protein NQZ68_038378 [Dissostichus eleginoides]|nr:hypothetical protein NQZ68_038378 [Dissostichus eleginoides]
MGFVILANNCLKPAYLQQHQSSKHGIKGEGGKISQLTVKQRTIKKKRKGHVCNSMSDGNFGHLSCSVQDLHKESSDHQGELRSRMGSSQMLSVRLIDRYLSSAETQQACSQPANC